MYTYVSIPCTVRRLCMYLFGQKGFMQARSRDDPGIHQREIIQIPNSPAFRDVRSKPWSHPKFKRKCLKQLFAASHHHLLLMRPSARMRNSPLRMPCHQDWGSAQRACHRCRLCRAHASCTPCAPSWWQLPHKSASARWRARPRLLRRRRRRVRFFFPALNKCAMSMLWAHSGGASYANGRPQLRLCNTCAKE